MPELPEVETVRRGLAPVLVGRRLARVEARRPDLRFPLPQGFSARLTGARVVDLARRAKYLLAHLDTGETLVAHLGMSGRFSVLGPEGAANPGKFHYAAAPDPAHTHVVFETDEGVQVSYNDPRRFGFMDLEATEGLSASRHFLGMGPEPLEPAFDARWLKTALADKRQSVKASLLDQRIVAGLGNIYVCEALYRARIDPRRAAGAIAGPRLEGLAGAIREVLAAAIAAGGSSLRDFAASDGALGYFQHAFSVYGREGEACPRPTCGHAVRRVVQAGRSTFFCPRCQR